MDISVGFFLDNLYMNKKYLIVAVLVSLFIYFRKIDYYKLMPRKNIITALLIGLWTYLSLQEPIIIIVGLSILLLLQFN